MAYKELWLEKKYNRGPLLIIEIVRVLLGVLVIGFWVDNLVPTQIALFIITPFIILVLVLFSKRIQALYQRIEGRFINNLNARELAEADTFDANLSRRNADLQSGLLPWDAHIVEMEVNPHAEYIGKSLVELGWREHFGINIAYIKRGDKLLQVPDRNSRLMPFDHVGIIATDEQLQPFKTVFDASESVAPNEMDIDSIVLQKVLVDEHTQLKGRDIRNSGLRERTQGLIVGIQRGNERILNPDSNMVLEWGDILWVVGHKKKIQQLSQR